MPAMWGRRRFWKHGRRSRRSSESAATWMQSPGRGAAGDGRGRSGHGMIYILHNVKALDLDPAASGFCIVVSGHSHKPGKTERDGVLYINPGSAGPRRFELPVTLALLWPGRLTHEVEFVDLLESR